MSDQQSQSEADHAAAMQAVSPAQNTSPPAPVYAGGEEKEGEVRQYQPPRYAFFTSGEFASSEPVPLRVIAPVSST